MTSSVQKRSVLDTFPREVVAQSVEKLSQEGRLHDLMKDVPPDLPADAVMPAGWSVDDNERIVRVVVDGEGVRRDVCARRPLFPARLIEAEDQEYVELCFKVDGSARWRTTTTSRAVLANAKRLPELAGRGVAVTSNNARQLVDFLAEFLATNRLPRADGRMRCGWIDRRTFLLGRTAIGAQDISVVPNTDDEIGCEVLDAIRSGGDEDEHREILREGIERSPAVALGLAASLAAPYLEVVDLPPFGVHFFGAGGTGKTATVRVAMSVWGATGSAAALQASGVVRPAQGTPKSLLDSARVTNGLPFAATDLNADLLGGQSARRQTGAVVHALVNGAGFPVKRRNGFGNRTGGKWRSTVLLEGEVSIDDLSPRDGTARRYIQVPEPFVDGPSSVLGELAARAALHFGYAGRQAIDHLVGLGSSARELLGTEHEELACEILRTYDRTDPMFLSQSRALAAAVVVVRDVGPVIGVDVELWEDRVRSCFRRAMAFVVTSGVGGRQLERAAQCLFDLVSRVRMRLLTRHLGAHTASASNTDYCGVIVRGDANSVEEVALRTRVVMEALEADGHSPSVWISNLAEAGVIVRPSTQKGDLGEIATTRRILGVRARCYVIRMPSGVSGEAGVPGVYAVPREAVDPQRPDTPVTPDTSRALGGAGRRDDDQQRGT